MHDTMYSLKSKHSNTLKEFKLCYEVKSGILGGYKIYEAHYPKLISLIFDKKIVLGYYHSTC